MQVISSKSMSHVLSVNKSILVSRLLIRKALSTISNQPNMRFRVIETRRWFRRLQNQAPSAPANVQIKCGET